jgi:arginyl-tRNA synthetase
MQLAKPLKANPRQLAEQLKSACWPRRRSAVGGRHRDRRARLSEHPPQARRQAAGVREVLAQHERYGWQPARGETMMVEFVSANPTGPLHVGHGRQAALGDALCNLFATQGWRCTASSITTTRACRSTR